MTEKSFSLLHEGVAAMVVSMCLVSAASDGAVSGSLASGLGPYVAAAVYALLQREIWAVAASHGSGVAVEAGAERQYEAVVAQLLGPVLSASECAAKEHAAVIRSCMWLGQAMVTTRTGAVRSTERGRGGGSGGKGESSALFEALECATIYVRQLTTQLSSLSPSTPLQIALESFGGAVSLLVNVLLPWVQVLEHGTGLLTDGAADATIPVPLTVDEQRERVQLLQAAVRSVSLHRPLATAIAMSRFSSGESSIPGADLSVAGPLLGRLVEFAEANLACRQDIQALLLCREVVGCVLSWRLAGDVSSVLQQLFRSVSTAGIQIVAAEVEKARKGGEGERGREEDEACCDDNDQDAEGGRASAVALLASVWDGVIVASLIAAHPPLPLLLPSGHSFTPPLLPLAVLGGTEGVLSMIDVLVGLICSGSLRGPAEGSLLHGAITGGRDGQ